MRPGNARERAILDRISAARMHLPPWVALAATLDPCALRFKLRALGIDIAAPHARAVLELVDHAGANSMLESQTISTRYAAVDRALKKRAIWE